MNNYMKTIISGLKQWVSSQKSDWNQNDSSAANFIKNRPFYSEEKEKVLFSGNISAENAWDNVYGAEGLAYGLSFTTGQIYKIAFDNVEYLCECKLLESDKVFGNTMMVGAGEETGEPFFIAYNDNYGLSLYCLAEGTHSLSISGTVEEVHQIDKKYVPIPELANVAFSGDYWDLENTPYIPWDVVQYNETQYLNDDQKLTARNNIGASGATNLLNGIATGSLRSNNSAEESSDYSIGQNSIALGRGTKASGHASHAEGIDTVASETCSHAEGSNTTASGVDSHAEGGYTTASGNWSHAEGYETTASERQSHAEGKESTASGEYSHAEGYKSIASAQSSHAEGWSTYSASTGSHSEGYHSQATAQYSHAEGNMTATFGDSSHAEGKGYDVLGYITGEANATTYSLTSSLQNKLRVGMTISYAGDSYAKVTAINGNQVTLNKTLSSVALSNAPAYVLSSGYALGSYSHSEGNGTIAIGEASHTEGNYTIASSNHQHVQGKYNIEDSSNKYAHIVGNGSSDTARSNAHTLDWDGLGWFAGGLKVGGTSQDDSTAVEVALKTEATTTSAGLLSAADKQKLDGIAAGATANKGDITGVTAGTGLSGGGTSGSVTLSLGTVGTAGTYGPTANVSGTNGTTIKVPQITVDAYGRVTSVTERTYTSKDTTYTASNGITLSGTNFTNSGVRSISTGSSNGTISVNTNGTSADVKVKGLGTAAYTASTAYDTAGAASTAESNAKSYTDTQVANYLPLTGGTISGDLILGDGTNTSAYDFYIRRLVNEVQKSGRIYWGTEGVLRLQAASDGTIFNYLDLKSDSTVFKQPVTIASGGTNAATAEQALINLGGVNKAGDTMTGALNMDAKIIMKNNTSIQAKDTEGTAYSMMFMSTTNRLQIGYGMPDSYAVQINPMIRITSKSYGTTLPDAGLSGRLFFKKVSS